MTALILDCDGVLADTERFGHLPAFNQTFETAGLGVRWSEAEYGQKLAIGGGKERMASLFDDQEFLRRNHIPDDSEARRELLSDWHRRKTGFFTALVADGAVPPRSGVSRLITDALDDGWEVAVASTSATESVRAVLRRAVGETTAAQVPIFAGDAVPAKKPDPAIYELAVERLGVRADDAVVIEDSRNGLLAATGAGLPCLVTVNAYTASERFDEAVLVVSELGDPGGAPIEVLADRGHVHPAGMVTLADLRACIRAGTSAMPAGDNTEGGRP